MLPPEAATAAIIALTLAAVVLWAIPDGRGCTECLHCQREAAERARLTFERWHDSEHKGMGHGAGTPDRYRCADERCPRNPTGPDNWLGTI